MTERVAAVLSGIIVLGVVAVALIKRPAGAARSPEQTVRAAIDAARDGDADAYLECFAGNLRRELEAARNDAGDEAFRLGIRARIAGMTGVAISRSPQAEAGKLDSECLLDVEIVYRDRNQRQQYRMTRQAGDRWAIAAVDGARPVTMPVRYGGRVGEGLRKPQDTEIKP